MQIFSKQTKSQTLIELYLFWKNQIVWFGKLDGSVFTTLASCLIFFYLGPLMPFSPFFFLQNILHFQIFKFSSFLDFALKLSKLDTPVWQTGQSVFSGIAKFGHQQRLLVVPTSVPLGSR
jgi:hypothetical protein